MSTFTDDFNRPDGPVGNGWTSAGGTWNISGNQLRGNGASRLYRAPFAGAQVVRARIYTTTGGASATMMHPILKANAGTVAFYGGRVSRSGTNWACVIYKRNGINEVSLASATMAASGQSYVTIELAYSEGNLTLLVNNAPIVTAFDNAYAANDNLGLRGYYTDQYCDWFYADDVSPVAFDEVNEPLVQMAVEQGVEFVGTGTAWTPGVPGDPVFTVDKGTLSGQEIQSATQATANYLPPQADDVATFTDPSTGQTDQVALSTGFQVNASGSADEYYDTLQAGVGGLGPIDPVGFLQLITDLAQFLYQIGDTSVAEMSARIGTRDDVPTLQASNLDLISNWASIDTWVTNGQPATPSLRTYIEAMDTRTSSTESQMTQLRGIPAIGLYDILEAIGPTTGTDVAEILAQLAAIRTESLLTLEGPISAVLNAQGLGLPTIRDVLDFIDTIKTENGWDLESVHSWTGDILSALTSTEANLLLSIAEQTGIINQHIDATETAIRGLDSVDLTSLHDQSNAIWGGDHHSVSDVYNLLDTIPGTDDRNLTQIYNAVLALPQSQVSLQPVLTAINNLSAQLSNVQTSILNAIAAIRPADYPLWPGAGSATLGVPVSGAGDLAIPGPLDGLLIDVTTWPRDIEAWTNGGTRALKYAGHITFVSDIAYTEEIQFPATNKRVVVPKSMLTAASALVHLRAGVQATITPWSYTP